MALKPVLAYSTLYHTKLLRHCLWPFRHTFVPISIRLPPERSITHIVPNTIWQLSLLLPLLLLSIKASSQGRYNYSHTTLERVASPCHSVLETPTASRPLLRKSHHLNRGPPGWRAWDNHPNRAIFGMQWLGIQATYRGTPVSSWLSWLWWARCLPKISCELKNMLFPLLSVWYLQHGADALVVGSI